MAGRTRLISVPPARGGDDRRGYRQLSGSMGAMMPDPNAPMNEGVPTERFEAPLADDAAWQRTVAMREAAEGLPQAQAAPVAQYIPQTPYIPPTARADRLNADLSTLPDRFALEIERKGERWKVTAPAVHSGLWKAGDDLPTVVEESLAALAEMVGLDGVVAKPRRRRA